MEQQKDQGFYYVIPAELVERGNLTKAILYGLITSLANKEGYCWATNSYLAQKMGMRSQSQVSRHLRELKEGGWIVIDVAVQEGNLRKISLVSPILEKNKTPRVENQKGPYEKPEPPLMENHKKVLSNKVLKESKNTLSSFRKNELFESIWRNYPLKIGKTKAKKKFLATVNTLDDWQNIQASLKNYKTHLAVNSWKNPQDGKTWFNSWQDWIEPVNPAANDKKSADSLEEVKLIIAAKLDHDLSLASIKSALESVSENHWPIVKQYLIDKKVYSEAVYQEAERTVREEVMRQRAKFRNLMGGANQCPAA